MKKLIVFVLLIMAFYANAQRKLWINDSVRIDTKGVSNLLVSKEESIKPLFDRYGMFIWHDAEPHEGVKLGMNDTLFQVLIPRKQNENIRVSGYYGWLNKYFTQIFNKRIGMESMYGQIDKEWFMSPGEHIINAWNKRINYPNNWNIPNGDGEGCDCAFANDPSIGDKLEFTFSGRGIKIISEKVSTHGIVNIILDGKLVKENVDLYESDSAKVIPYILYEINNLNSQQHTIEIEVVGKNPSSSNYYFVLHRFEITDKRVEPETVQVYDTTFIEEKVIVYDSVKVETGTLISNHSEYHKAIESAIQYGGIQLTRKGYYEVWKEGELIRIKQPDIEIK